MTEILVFFGSLGLLLAADYILILMRAGFTQTSHARLLALRDSQGKEVAQTVALLPGITRLKASLNLVLALVRFLLVGLVLHFISLQPVASPLVVSASSLFLLALLLFWYEWAVEQNALRNPEAVALRLTPLARFLMAVTSVFLIVPLAFSKESASAADGTGNVTEDELKTLVDAGQEEGLFELGERRMIYSIIGLRDTLAREIMVPRIDMLTLEVNTPLSEAVDALLRSGHSRVPVYEETVDNTLGLLYAKDLLRVWREGNQLESLRSLLRPAYFVPEAKKVDELLTEMQSQRIHLAVVVDEYGGVAGLVTLEDIVEEIVGEIRDEYDQSEEAPYQALKNGEYLFLGRVDLDDFNEIMGSSLQKDEAETLGGYIYSRLGRVPHVGEMVQTDNLLLSVEQVSARRIRKVRARWVQPELESGDDKSNAIG